MKPAPSNVGLSSPLFLLVGVLGQAVCDVLRPSHDECLGHLEERIMMPYFELRTTNSSVSSNMMIIGTYSKRMTRRIRLQVFLNRLHGS